MVSTRLTLNPQFRHLALGFESLFDELERINNFNTVDNYPPHNVIKVSDDEYVIEFSVAGFNEGDINVTEHNGVLKVVGDVKKEETDKTLEYVYKGISTKSFSKSFRLADHVKVIGAQVVNGLLRVALKRDVPEEAKPKSIAIDYKK